MKLGNPDPQARSRCLLILQIDILIKYRSSSRPSAPLRMGYKQLHGVQMIRCSSSLQVGPRANPIRFDYLILCRGGKVDRHDFNF